MANKDMNQVLGSLLVLLNDSNAIAKPYSGYVGSFFFGPNQEITFRNRAPKGRIRPGDTYIEGKSFGNTWKHSKYYNVHIDFFTVHGFKDTTGKKEIELLNRYNQLIEDAIRQNPGSYGFLTVQEMTNDTPPQRADDVGQNVWVTSTLLVLKERHC